MMLGEESMSRAPRLLLSLRNVFFCLFHVQLRQEMREEGRRGPVELERDSRLTPGGRPVKLQFSEGRVAGEESADEH